MKALKGSETHDKYLETVAKAERSHANRFQKTLDGLTD